MSNDIQVFNHPDFGNIRSVIIDSEPWLVGKDVAEALGYSNSKDAIGTHVDEDDRRVIQRSEITTFDIPNRGMTIINESGVYSLIFGSKLPKAREFKHWVTSEVLPSLRKTGSYTNPMHDAESNPSDDLKQRRMVVQEQEAKAKLAKLWLQAGKMAADETRKNICLAYVSRTLTGEFALPLPQSERRTYSATEIGKALGITANAVGRIAKKYGFKTEEYGTFVWDVAKGNHRKQVESFRYFDSVVEAMRPYAVKYRFRVIEGG